MSHPTVHPWLIANCKTAKPGECLINPFAVGSHGYIPVSIPGARRRPLAHRYVCQMFNGSPPSEKHQAAHSCGNKRCVNPHHLRWATRIENEADKIKHGTATAGERNGAAKITKNIAVEIRNANGTTNRSLADRYGISASSIGRIRNGVAWRDV